MFSRSLKTTLALYFLPISVVPVIVISIYAITIFQKNTQTLIAQRASSEKDAIIAEIDSLEAELLSQVGSHANAQGWSKALRATNQDSINRLIQQFPKNREYAVYSLGGVRIFGQAQRENLNTRSLKLVNQFGRTLGRKPNEGLGFTIVTRAVIQDRSKKRIGILEERYAFTSKDLEEIKERRKVEALILNNEGVPLTSSLVLGDEFLSKMAKQSSRDSIESPIVQLGESRFANYFFSIPAPLNRAQSWGKLVLFVPLSQTDATLNQLKTAMVYVSVVLALVAALLIFLFSRRLVKPIEKIVTEMRRMELGHFEPLPEQDPNEEIEYLVKSFNDMARSVRETKRALELKLLELHHANEEIKNTQTTLVQSAKMASLGEIVAGVAHELNNPIGFIYSNMHHLTGYVKRIQKCLEAYKVAAQSLPEQRKAKLQKVLEEEEIDFILKDIQDLTRSCVDGAERTKEIVLGLRIFSRMDEATFQSANVLDGLKATMRLLKTQAKGRIELHEQYNDLPEIECNLSQLNQVFMNVISNAIQSIPQKGDIWIRTRSIPPFIEIQIEDSGCGMSPEVQGKIFDPFFTTKDIGEGTGLGLSIAYGLIQKHQGTIEVKSSEGKGSCFTIRLPISQDHTDQPTVEKSQSGS